MTAKEREPWWTWHWDSDDVGPSSISWKCIKRWRRGSLLTIYRMESTTDDVLWLFYGPFNYCIGFGKER